MTAPSCEPKPPHEDLPTPEALMLIWGTEYADDWHLFRLAMKELIVRDIIRPVTEIHVGRGGKTTTSIQLLMNHQQTPRIPMSLRSFPDIFKLACGTKANTSVGIFAYRIKDFFHHPTYVHRNVIPALASKGLYDNEEYQTTHFPNRIKTHTRYFPIEAGMLRARVIAERLGRCSAHRANCHWNRNYAPTKLPSPSPSATRCSPTLTERSPRSAKPTGSKRAEERRATHNLHKQNFISHKHH